MSAVAQRASATLRPRVGSAALRSAARPVLAPRRAAGRHVRVAAGLVEKLNAEQLEVAIAERDKPLVIDFFARRGGACAVVELCQRATQRHSRR